ncbi:hypothetical protein SteCoe_7602 [Stentor coeruleus]|uniref:Uncharacterized protein n=1 Tax=Stentor coeruleus TaxID=5963 RepID=A0A1R2CM70_9CILI|nr:hypothetical protein SteCoe_7602 [Stentor coeruleus]
MELNCSVANCHEEVIWQCSCPEKFTFCLNHIRSHSRTKKCSTINIKNIYLESLANKYKNALTNLESDYIKLAQEIIFEVNKCLKDNIKYIKTKKNEIVNLILDQQNEEADTIINWANSLKVLQRERKQYNLSLRKLLDIENNSIKVVKDEKFEGEYKITAKKLKEACAHIKGIETELKKTQEENKKLKDQFESAKKNNETCVEIKGIETELKKTQEENKKLKDELESAKKILGEEKDLLEEKNLKLNKDLQDLQQDLSSEVKSNEEYKTPALFEEFKSMIELETFLNMSLEQKKNLLAQMNFKEFQRDFIEKKWYINGIIIAKDNNYISICKS